MTRSRSSIKLSDVKGLSPRNVYFRGALALIQSLRPLEKPMLRRATALRKLA